MVFQGSVVIAAFACRPPVHMLMRRSLIVSSYFNLLHCVGGTGGGSGGAQGRDETRRDDEPGKGTRVDEEWRMGESWLWKTTKGHVRGG